MSLFFVGLNPRWQQFRWLPETLNIMYSAAGFWDGNSWRRKFFFRQRGLKWLDCGGYTLLNKYGEYPFSPVAYANLVATLKPNYYASMDYPCEPNISRSSNLAENSERIAATVKNAACMIELEIHNPDARLVPVIQGYSLDEYLYCIDLHAQAGTIREYMAVGSMCRRVSNQELHKLIPAIAERSMQAGVKQLHFFGLKLDPALLDLSQFIWSRDSAVALDAYDPKLRAERGGRRWPKGPQEKRAAFESFFSRLDSMGLQYARSIQ